MTILLEARGISKAFPGVQALADVSMRLSAGEVLAVVGENGAGKSTLMKVLAGVYIPDAGTLHLNGAEVRPSDVAHAQRLGIVLIHQELNLAENLDVAGNVFLGHEPVAGGPLRFLRRRIHDDAARITGPLGLDCSTRTRVADLSIGQQQLVEIARALALQSRIIIMDEPTSSLTQRETERLYDVIRNLKRDGIGILYISHRMKEIQTIADRVTVLRDGKNAGELTREEISHEAMVRLMVGRELKQFFHRTGPPSPRCGEGPGVRGDLAIPSPPAPLPSGERGEASPRLGVRDLRYLSLEQPPLDLHVAAGEIVGMAGLMGAGRTEFAETLFGLRPSLSGDILLDGRPIRVRSPRDAIAHGIFLVPEDRRVQGLVLEASVKDNISLPSLDRLNFLRLVARRREADVASDMCSKLNVRTPHVRETVGLLSGGNQQKVVLAKWLYRGPRVLILDEPTRGVDVGAKSEIYALMDALAQQDIAILMISSDLEEILGMSDRVLVMHEGRLAGELAKAEMSEEAVMRLATGGRN